MSVTTAVIACFVPAIFLTATAGDVPVVVAANPFAVKRNKPLSLVDNGLHSAEAGGHQ
jgi:hypothetical protein